MSDHIPFEIQIEIIRRLPIESLIRFRSVSKPWKSVIDSSEFVADYSVHHSQPQRLLVSYRDPDDSEPKYVSIDDDDTFPQRKCSLHAPMVIKSIVNTEFLGSSHGLLCLYGCYDQEDDSSPDPGLDIVVLWNPSIRKSVVVKVSDELDYPYGTVLGFGVCPHTNDPKIVKINHMQVEVFTLSSGAWRIPYRNLPRKSICFGPFEGHHIAIDGFIYWIAFDRTNVGVYNLILSFDLTSEEFREIYLPEYLAQQLQETLRICKLRNSLVVVECDENLVFGVWMMEHGVPNAFKKLFTLDVPIASLHTVLGFRENGEPMLGTIGKYDNISIALEVFEPSSKHIKDLGIYRGIRSFSVSSYMETLILLDHPGCSFYSNM